MQSVAEIKARIKERTIAGPATSRANSPATTYTPIPTTVPTPSEVRSKTERRLLREESVNHPTTDFFRCKL